MEIIRESQDYAIKNDQALLLAKVSEYLYFHKIAKYVGWKMAWDHLLDYGPSVIQSMKNLVRVILCLDCVTSTCPLCESATELNQVSLTVNTIKEHTRNKGS